MRSGNANQLSRYFDSRVDIFLPGKSDNYSKSGAEMILRKISLPGTMVKNFQIKHRGRIRMDPCFGAGTLQTQ